KNTHFDDNALFLNGIYEYTSMPNDGYRAILPVPDFDYNQFTVLLRFKAQEFAAGKSTILVGGPSYRWFELRCQAEDLQLVLNNGRKVIAVPNAKLKPNTWTLIAAGLDLPRNQAFVSLNGSDLQTFDLGNGFNLDVIGTSEEQRDKAWTFTNYSDGNTFH